MGHHLDPDRSAKRRARVLQLHDQKVGRQAIADRLGMSYKTVVKIIAAAAREIPHS